MELDNTSHSFPCIKVKSQNRTSKNRILTTNNGILTHEDQIARLQKKEA